MARARVEFEPAYLLAQRPYRETSELLEVLTPGHGRVGLVARGTRGPKAKSRGTLALFRPLLISWAETGELGSMTAVEPAGAGVELHGERVFHGWYVNELVLKLLQRHDAHPALYAGYAGTLLKLGGTDIEAEAALRIFEKRLLEQLGYGLRLDRELLPGQHYRYRPQSGPVPAKTGEAGSYSAESLLALRNESLTTRPVLDEVRRLLRAALEPHAPRAALRTPRMLREMRRLRAGE